MNIQDLTPDAKFELSKHLSGSELVKLCSTSKSLRNTCNSSRFNNIWIQKIKEDFNIVYREKDAYREYLRLSYCVNKPIWVLERDDETLLFNTNEDAINFVISEIMNDAYYNEEEVSEILIGKQLELDNIFKYRRNNYYIYESKIIKSIDYDFNKQYDKILEKMRGVFKDEYVDEFIEEIIEYYKYDEYVVKTSKEDVYKLGKEFCKTNNIEKCDNFLKNIYELLNLK